MAEWREKPALKGVQIKVDRARFHLDTLNDLVEPLQHGIDFVIVGRVCRDGREHIYRVANAPEPDPLWSTASGDCAHNLRSALDHLACILAGKSVSRTTSFPSRRSRCQWDARLQRAVPAPLNLAGKIAPEPMAVIESVQPYNGGSDGSNLLCLNELDIMDKHHQLLVIHHAIVGSSTAGWDDEGFLDDLPEIVQLDQPLEPGRVVAKVIYREPHSALDPHLKFYPHVFFAKGPAPFAGRMVTRVLTELLRWVEAELLPRFAPFVPSG